ncbi:fumarylacetoacetate hydrolase family protein [Scleromatobacter humisilvae]|uniref:Fumarylacetoacetate hydrolase family protein n=1 Tax=Scleromatobacter humisilvae TaxID=2897159 RepID=A0A9X1YK10_9BURK|nr:fumarylacetoacetate hydrolase family protein [Scleromatobacter humisilvae]MCK9687117.1 fumarylacetoacetate hydrolase family protein [Scleromatobacter humisilvae]
MRIVHFETGGAVGIAADAGSGWHGLTRRDGGFPGTLPELIAQGADLVRIGASLAQSPAIDLDAVRLLPPVPAPPKILCVGLNYDDHLEESGLNRPVYPEIFARFATSLIAHRAPIRRPPESTALDYEAELAIVIGKPGRRIPRDQALAHVAGYSLFNDATIRDFQLRTPQWTMGKNFDGSGAFGPWLVTPDAVPPGAHGLRIEGRLNGQVMQQSSTDKLIFGVAALIEMISVAMSLERGDVIITGTPGGVGAARKPPVYMRAGDVFEVEIEGIGVLSNVVRDEADAT